MNYFSEKKIMFSVAAAVLYLVIASAPVYNFVGKLLNMDYDDASSNDRHVLLVVHGLVYFLATLLLVNVMVMPSA